MTASTKRIHEWCESFQNAPLASRVVAGLHGRSAEIWQRTFELLRQESPEYRNAIDDEFTKESKGHCGELLETIIAVARGSPEVGSTDAFDFVRTHAEWRAKHQVPLAASLHAYRLAHKTYWGITRESLLRHSDRNEALRSLTMLSDFWMDFFDFVGAILAEAHSVEEGLGVAQNTRTYVGLIDDLLRGIEPKAAEARRLRTLCGIRSPAPKAVIVGRPFESENGKEIDLDVTLRSLVRFIEQILPSAIFGKLIDIRHGEVTVIICSEAEPSRGFLDALRKHGFGRRASSGLAAGFGGSLDTPEIARLPECCEEARLALDFTSESHPVMHFSEIDLAQYLIRRADATALRLIPERIRRLISANGKQSGELPHTIRAFAECSLNVKQTARHLGVHPNTIYFRLDQIKKLTAVDPRTFSGTSLLITTLQLLEIHVVDNHSALSAGPPTS